MTKQHRQSAVSQLLSFLLLIAFGIYAEPPLPDPVQPGAYPVGVTTTTFLDHSRTDPATKGPRSLMTEIWYPATEETRGLPANKLSDFFMRNRSPELALLLLAGFGIELAEADKAFHNFAIRDARITDGEFPLILFSHGNSGMRMQNAFWCEHLASHGYIVVAPDHTGNASVTFVNGAPVLFESGREARERSAKDRPQDLSFLIDQMELLNKGNDSRFLGRVDMTRIGAAGHSFGGFTCTWLANNEPRVKAIIPMAGIAEDRTNYECPIMLFVAAEDDTLSADRMALFPKYYEESKGPRYFIEFKNAGHFSFTEMYQLKPDFGDGVGTGTRITNGEPLDYVTLDIVYPLMNGYSTAFFSKYLRGQEGYAAYLAVNHNPEELLYKNAP